MEREGEELSGVVCHRRGCSQGTIFAKMMVMRMRLKFQCDEFSGALSMSSVMRSCTIHVCSVLKLEKNRAFNFLGWSVSFPRSLPHLSSRLLSRTIGYTTPSSTAFDLTVSPREQEAMPQCYTTLPGEQAGYL